MLKMQNKIEEKIKDIEMQLLAGYEIIKMPRGKKYNQELKNRIAQHNSNIIHDSKYTLISDYINSSTKMTISCKIHGNFFQSLNNHLSGKGCPICGVESNAKTLSQEAKDNFIPRANIIHDNFYTYLRTDYINSRIKVIITCPIHGDFKQTPDNHLKGSGCPICYENKARVNFIPRANIIHNNLYGYMNFVYVNSRTKGYITCFKHGDFLQTPSKHLGGQGCPECAIENKIKDAKFNFISRANIVHNFSYVYRNFNYINAHVKGYITCFKHGDFLQTSNSHLNGAGCPKCGNIENNRKRMQEAKDNFVPRANIIHNNLYGYLNFNYINARIKGFITCFEHGDFLQNPNNHLNGQGCPSCLWDRDQPTQLYIIQSDCETMIKIGVSINPEARLKQLLAEQPFESKLIKTFEFKDFPTALSIEQEIHHKLKDHNAGFNGFDGATEWFYVSIDEAINKIKKPLN